MLGPAPAVQSTVPPDAVREQVLGWSALKTGLLHRDRQDGDPFGAARAGPGERFPRASPPAPSGRSGSPWGSAWEPLIATVALIPPEQLQHAEESAAVAWPPPRMRRLVLLPPPHQDRTRMFGTHVQQNT